MGWASQPARILPVVSRSGLRCPAVCQRGQPAADGRLVGPAPPALPARQAQPQERQQRREKKRQTRPALNSLPLPAGPRLPGTPMPAVCSSRSRRRCTAGRPGAIGNGPPGGYPRHWPGTAIKDRRERPFLPGPAWTALDFHAPPNHPAHDLSTRRQGSLNRRAAASGSPASASVTVVGPASTKKRKTIPAPSSAG